MHNNYRVILRTIASVLLFEGVAMVVPLIYAILIHDPSATAFFTPAVFCLLDYRILFRYFSLYAGRTGLYSCRLYF